MSKEELKAKYARIANDSSQLEMFKNDVIDGKIGGGDLPYPIIAITSDTTIGDVFDALNITPEPYHGASVLTICNDIIVQSYNQISFVNVEYAYYGGFGATISYYSYDGYCTFAYNDLSNKVRNPIDREIRAVLPRTNDAAIGDVLKVDSTKNAVWDTLSTGTKLYRHCFSFTDADFGTLQVGLITTSPDVLSISMFAGSYLLSNSAGNAGDSIVSVYAESGYHILLGKYSSGGKTGVDLSVLGSVSGTLTLKSISWNAVTNFSGDTVTAL